MAEVHPNHLDGTEREPRWMSQQESERGLQTELADATPAYVDDIEELAAAQSYKRAMLDDAASSTSFRKGGARLPRAAQVRREGDMRILQGLMFNNLREGFGHLCQRARSHARRGGGFNWEPFSPVREAPSSS